MAQINVDRIRNDARAMFVQDVMIGGALQKLRQWTLEANHPGNPLYLNNSEGRGRLKEIRRQRLNKVSYFYSKKRALYSLSNTIAETDREDRETINTAFDRMKKLHEELHTVDLAQAATEERISESGEPFFKFALRNKIGLVHIEKMVSFLANTLPFTDEILVSQKTIDESEVILIGQGKPSESIGSFKSSILRLDNKETIYDAMEMKVIASQVTGITATDGDVFQYSLQGIDYEIAVPAQLQRKTEKGVLQLVSNMFTSEGLDFEKFWRINGKMLSEGYETVRPSAYFVIYSDKVDSEHPITQVRLEYPQEKMSYITLQDQTILFTLSNQKSFSILSDIRGENPYLLKFE